ncbi:MAG: hypothetical protein ABSB61_05815 [Anaerolineales bacterium]
MSEAADGLGTLSAAWSAHADRHEDTRVGIQFAVSCSGQPSQYHESAK